MTASDIVSLRKYTLNQQEQAWNEYEDSSTAKNKDKHTMWYNRREELENQLELILREVTGI